MKISVITTCLNGAAHLAEALQSVADQDYVDFEHLVIDGGSTDGSTDICRQFAERNPALRWWSGPDHGISDAMNRGLDLATGDVVAFLHADDYYPNSAVLSEVAATWKTFPGEAWLTGGLKEVDVYGHLLRELPPRRFTSRRLLRNNILYHPATFVRREVLLEVGRFDSTLRYAMDYDLWLRLRAYGSPVVTDLVLACFRVHPGSRSTVYRRAALKEEYAVRKRYLSGISPRVFHGCYHGLRFAYEWLNTRGK